MIAISGAEAQPLRLVRRWMVFALPPTICDFGIARGLLEELSRWHDGAVRPTGAEITRPASAFRSVTRVPGGHLGEIVQTVVEHLSGARV
jgi:hypothetical protein